MDLNDENDCVANLVSQNLPPLEKSEKGDIPPPPLEVQQLDMYAYLTLLRVFVFPSDIFVVNWYM